jgi:UDP-glucose 4-epimerase
MNKKERILILGGAGFIGSNLTEALVRNNKYNIRVFDLLKDGFSENLTSLKGKIEIISGDFLNINDLRKALKDVDYVFHLISFTTPGSSVDNLSIELDTNIKGTINLLQECVKSRIKKVIYASSGGSIYGNNKKGICNEEDKLDPISPHAISKMLIEKYLNYYRLHYGLDYLVLRYSNPYGPKQNILNKQGIVSIFLNLARQEKKIQIFGDGKNIRDYIFIEDAVNITKLLFEENTKHRIYNVGSGLGYSINEIIEAIEITLGKKIKTETLPQRDVDVRKIVLNTGRLKEEIEYNLKTDIKEGVRKTWEWINSNYN